VFLSSYICITLYGSGCLLRHLGPGRSAEVLRSIMFFNTQGPDHLRLVLLC
jgi:hypothetical protein